MTALQFLATFRHASVHAVGADDDICWMVAEADVDGTEPQFYLVMEMMGVIPARFVQNPALDAPDRVRDLFQSAERCE